MVGYARSGLRPREARGARKPSYRRLDRPGAATIARTSTAESSGSSLHKIERLVLEFAPVSASLLQAIPQARNRALALSVSARPRTLAERAARIGFAAELIGALAPELTHQEVVLRAMIDRLEASAKLPRLLLGREVLRAPHLARLPSEPAIDVVLALVLACTKGHAAALWARAADGRCTAVATTGDVTAMPAEAQELAAKTIAGETVTARPDGDLAVSDILRTRRGAAVLVLFGDDALSPDRRLLLREVEPLLTLALERRDQSSPAGDRGRASTASSCDGGQSDALTTVERRLSRLRFDLHDGPQQDILMLAEDLKLFRSQLQSALTPDHAHLLGRIDDLEARMVALDGDLRRISVSVQSPFLHQKSFEEALDGVVKAFTARCGLTPTVEVSGDFTSLTDSQHITLLGLIREALSNVREHSHARHVTVRVNVAAIDGSVTGSVTDDGRGFDPETMLVHAARSGHLGLVGMHERVRMLGGTTDIDSRPGGPTVISMALPAAPTDVPRHSE